jgi:hypothetical protein
MYIYISIYVCTHINIHIYILQTCMYSQDKNMHINIYIVYTYM